MTRAQHHRIFGVLPPPAPSAPNAGAPEESFTIADLGSAIKKVTPTLLLVGIATGAAFAIGSGLVSRFVFREKRR